MALHNSRWLLLAALLVSAVLHAATPAEPSVPAKPRVAVLMFDGVQLIDFAAPFEVFGQAGFDVYAVSSTGQPVKTAADLTVAVDHGFASAPPADIVVIPGGNVGDAAKDAATLAWIRTASAGAQHVLSICTGAHILAGTGLLDGKPATTFHQQFNAMSAAYPAVQVVRDQRWVDNGKLVTSAGLTSGLDASLHVLSKVRGADVARSVALHLEYDWAEDQGFVRGRLADQFARMPAQPLAFPEGTVFTRLTSLGDERDWVMDHRVESSLAPLALVQYLRGLASQDPALAVLEQPDPARLAWQYQSERGGNWQMDFHAGERQADHSYRFVIKTTRLD